MFVEDINTSPGTSGRGSVLPKVSAMNVAIIPCLVSSLLGFLPHDEAEDQVIRTIDDDDQLWKSLVCSGIWLVMIFFPTPYKVTASRRRLEPGRVDRRERYFFSTPFQKSCSAARIQVELTHANRYNLQGWQRARGNQV